MCIEPLIRNLKENNLIESLESTKIDIRIPKAYGYADDVAVAAKRTNDGVQGIFSEYELFSKASGLILNADKTEILSFNAARVINHEFNVTYRGSRYRLQSKEMIKINQFGTFGSKLAPSGDVT